MHWKKYKFFCKLTDPNPLFKDVRIEIFGILRLKFTIMMIFLIFQIKMEGDMFPPEEVVSYINETVIYIFIQNEIHYEFPAHTQKFIQLFCIYRKTGFKRILIDYLFEYGIPTI